MAKLQIDNNQSLNRFEASVNGKLATLDYRIEENAIFLLHVEVPPEEQGRGIAMELARAALEFSRDSGLTVVLRCPFIATYSRRHPELLHAAGGLF